MADLRVHLRAVGADDTLGRHGLRVLGYNLSKRFNGEDITVAHGGWMSSAHDRYERFKHAAALSIPANMVGSDSLFVEGAVREVYH